MHCAYSALMLTPDFPVLSLKHSTAMAMGQQLFLPENSEIEFFPYLWYWKAIFVEEHALALPRI